MKLTVIVALSMAICPAAFGAAAVSYPTPYPANIQPDRSTPAERALAKRQKDLNDKLLAIRAEGLELRDADGGTLTAAHRAYLQAKLDDLNTEAATTAATAQ